MLLRLCKWLLILNFASLLLVSKSFVLSKFGIRAEDIFGFLSLLILPFILLKVGRIISQRLLVIIFIYFFYLALISLFQSFGYSLYILILYFKELSYFAFFLITFYFCYRSSAETISRFLRLILIISVPNILYIYYQLFFGTHHGMYGVTFFGHSDSPATAGLLSIMVFFISYIYSQFFKRNIWTNLHLIATIIIIFFIGSKLVVAGFFGFFALIILLERNKKKLLVSIFII